MAKKHDSADASLPEEVCSGYTHILMSIPRRTSLLVQVGVQDRILMAACQLKLAKAILAVLAGQRHHVVGDGISNIPIITPKRCAEILAR